MDTPNKPRKSIAQRVIDFIHTLFSSEFWRDLRKDLREIYTFYLDDESRKQLAQMGAVRRFFRVAILILRALYSKLTPVRQILLILAIVLFVFPHSQWQDGSTSYSVSWSPAGFLILLIILLLELKDKLLAKDELKAGHSVQEALMPREMPSLDGWDIWLFTTPANDVGGDLVDYLKLDETTLDLTLADVAGKGLGAALMSAKLQATLRAIAPQCESLDEVANNVNEIICRDGVPSRFATLVYLRINARSGDIRLLNAGHLPPIMLHAHNLEQLPRAAPAIGLTADAQFRGQEALLDSGECLVIVSDGVLEARNEKGEFYGEDRFNKLLMTLHGIDARSMGGIIFQDVERFIGQAARSDDISMIVLRKL